MCSPIDAAPRGVQERGVDIQLSMDHKNMGNLGREVESNRAGRRDGERSSLTKFGDRRNQDGEEDILAIELAIESVGGVLCSNCQF
jgi:hypothetical protein